MRGDPQAIKKGSGILETRMTQNLLSMIGVVSGSKMRTNNEGVSPPKARPNDEGVSPPKARPNDEGVPLP